MNRILPVHVSICGAAVVSMLLMSGATTDASAQPLRAGSEGEEQGRSTAARSVARGSNTFGINLYRTLGEATPGANLFFSPYSMAVALTMTAEGATGETEAEMVRVLHIPAETSTGSRAVTTAHHGHRLLGQGLRDAAGIGTPLVRSRIRDLRAALAAANAEADAHTQARRWEEAETSRELSATLAQELNALLTRVDRFDLRIANALWVDRAISLRPEFVQAIESAYAQTTSAGGGDDGGGEGKPPGIVTELDIAGQPEQSRVRINDWVAAHTNDRITDLIPPGGLSPLARLVITNAVYFLGEWATPFDEAMTREEPFTLPDGQSRSIMFMNDSQYETASYAAFSGDGSYFVTPMSVPRVAAGQSAETYPDDDGFQIIELPYKGGALSMVMIAPRRHDGLEAIESLLTTESLEIWLGQLEQRSVDVMIPRFTLSWDDDLSSALQSMGMKRAFTDPALPGGAEFGGISEGSSISQQLFIGGVLHKAWIEVTEKGTEAAAATAVIMVTTSAPAMTEMIPFIPQFRADRPFVFLIRDTTSGLILFMGRVVEPSAQA